jgi:hypothetical protein
MYCIYNLISNINRCKKLLRCKVALSLGENKIDSPKCNHTCHTRRAAGAMSVGIRYIYCIIPASTTLRFSTPFTRDLESTTDS